jgi:DNA-binding NarL/FixJ family response regulator
MSTLQDLVRGTNVKKHDHYKRIADQLTQRGQNVLDLLSKGLNRREVAAKLGISISTVDTYKSIILDYYKIECDILPEEHLNYHSLYKEFGPDKCNCENNAHGQKDCELVIARLTPKQKTVLRLFAAGLNSKEVAEQLRLSLQTVYYHKTKLLRCCQGVWNMPRDECKRYTFLQQNFANYFNGTQ